MSDIGKCHSCSEAYAADSLWGSLCHCCGRCYHTETGAPLGPNQLVRETAQRRGDGSLESLSQEWRGAGGNRYGVRIAHVRLAAAGAGYSWGIFALGDEYPDIAGMAASEADAWVQIGGELEGEP